MTKEEKKKYKSEILMVIHQDMEAGYRVGALTTKEMREFDEGCLVPEAVPVRKPVRRQSKPAAAAAAVPRPKSAAPACASPRK